MWARPSLPLTLDRLPDGITPWLEDIASTDIVVVEHVTLAEDLLVPFGEISGLADGDADQLCIFNLCTGFGRRRCRRDGGLLFRGGGLVGAWRRLLHLEFHKVYVLDLELLCLDEAVKVGDGDDVGGGVGLGVECDAGFGASLGQGCVYDDEDWVGSFCGVLRSGEGERGCYAGRAERRRTGVKVSLNLVRSRRCSSPHLHPCRRRTTASRHPRQQRASP